MLASWKKTSTRKNKRMNAKEVGVYCMVEVWGVGARRDTKQFVWTGLDWESLVLGRSRGVQFEFSWFLKKDTEQASSSANNFRR